MTTNIEFCNIPSYLRAGQLYRSLSSDDPSSGLDIPADCFCPNGSEVADIHGLIKLLKVTLFWMLDKIPHGILDFCSENEVEVWRDAILDIPGAIESELVPALLAAYSAPGMIPFKDILKTGRWELIEHAISRLRKDYPATFYAAGAGHLRALAFLHKKGFVWHIGACTAASAHGHLNCLQYAHENGCPWDSKVSVWAAQNGHLPCLQYAHQQGLVWHSDVCKYAALSGKLECLQYAHHHGCPWESDAVASAAQHGRKECLQFALQMGCPHEENASILASKNNQLDCLQLLHMHNNAWSVATACAAATNSDAACLTYLHTHGCPWDEYTPAMSALSGAVQPLRYALTHGCPYYEEDLMEATVEGSSFECLQFLVEEVGIAIDDTLFMAALLRGNLQCLQYLVECGCLQTAAPFSSEEAQLEYYEHIFTSNNSEFVICVEYAMECGWVMCEGLKSFIAERDVENCRELLERVGRLAANGSDNAVEVPPATLAIRLISLSNALNSFTNMIFMGSE